MLVLAFQILALLTLLLVADLFKIKLKASKAGIKRLS